MALIIDTFSGAGGTATSLETRDDAKEKEGVLPALLLLLHLARLCSDGACPLCPLTPPKGDTLREADFSVRCTILRLGCIGGARREYGRGAGEAYYDWV